MLHWNVSNTFALKNVSRATAPKSGSIRKLTDTSGGDAKRERDLGSKYSDTDVCIWDVHQDARSETVFLKGSAVLVDGYLRGRARVEEFWKVRMSSTWDITNWLVYMIPITHRPLNNLALCALLTKRITVLLKLPCSLNGNDQETQWAIVRVDLDRSWSVNDWGIVTQLRWYDSGGEILQRSSHLSQ